METKLSHAQGASSPIAKRPLWTLAEDDFLRANYVSMNVSQISHAIGRSVRAVHHRMERLGLRVPMEERGRRIAASRQDQTAENNPNWKGGISSNHYRYKRIQRQRYPDRVRARDMVTQAIRTGKLRRGRCSICGSINAEAHHEDYSRPLDVTWLCPKHHDELHRTKKACAS